MTTKYYRISPYVHCSSICPFKDGVLLSFYNGPECSDTQATNLLYLVNGEIKWHKKFPNGTGNSVVYSFKNKTFMIYSVFTNNPGIVRPVDKWKYCINKKIRIYNNLKIIDEQDLEIDTGFLVRCTPIIVKHKLYLPIYNETGYGQVLRSNDGFMWEKLGKIGYNYKINQNNVAIQPTLWYDGHIIHSLLRDMSFNRRAWYSCSKDLGLTWFDISSTSIWNDNNSIVAINNNTSFPHIVWNEGPGRDILMLGRILDGAVRKIRKLNINRASYPNYCFDNNNGLYITHTDGPSIAVHHYDDKNKL